MPDYFHATGGSTYKEGAASAFLPGRYVGLPSVNYINKTSYPEIDALFAGIASYNNFADNLSTNDVGISASGNTDASVVYSADSTKKHTIDGVFVSYRSTPTSGRLDILSGTGVIFSITIPDTLPHNFNFPKGISSNKNEALTVKLVAAGSGVIGSVNVIGHRLDTVVN